MKAVKKNVDARYVIARGIVFNILDNVGFVLAACKCKTIMPSHLEAVAMIQNTIRKNNIGSTPSSRSSKMVQQRGGAQVLPSEYFGVNSSSYHDISQVANLETHMFADAAIARPEMLIKMGGGARVGGVSLTMIKNAIRDYNEMKKTGIKVNKDALTMIKASTDINVAEIEAAVGKDASLQDVRDFVKRNKNMSHLRAMI
jgi:hypothetical protein